MKTLILTILFITLVFANFSESLTLAKTHQNLGFYSKAKEILKDLTPKNDKEKALIYLSLADLYLSTNDIEKTQEYLKKVQDLKLKDENIVVNTLNTLAGIDMLEGYFIDAKDKFVKALELAKDENLEFNILTNLVLAEIEINENTLKFAKEALEKIVNAKDSEKKAQTLITLGIILKNSGDDELFKLSFKALNEAFKIAKNFDNSKIKSLAYGYLAQVYEDNRQFDEAKKLTKSAIFYAQEEREVSELLYFWQWQLARVLNELNQKEEAIRVYKEAIKTLTPIKKEFFKGYRNYKDSFSENVKPVYIGIVELLIEKAQNSKNKQKILREVIDIMETLKSMELENLFSDECLLKYKSKIKPLTSPPTDTVILYPIALPKKIVTLILFNNEILVNSFEIPYVEFDEIARDFRQKLQTRVTKRFFYGAKELNDILIKDIEPLLQKRNIKRLIIAPDGVLRLIPFSTLYDGKKFLIEKYEIVTALSMEFTDLSKHRERHFFVGGISEARQGFSALPNVVNELNEVKEIISAKESIQNSNFTLDNLKDKFQKNDYSIVHIATHGVFMGEPKDSFLLAYDEKLTMKKLQNLMSLTKYKEGVELLTLSACQSALGDERSALGLAGVGLRAGAKSAIATLWFVDDEATSIAIREFYKNLANGESKAKALQNAQIKLLKQKRYAHPSYWAPFLLIGNWL